MADWKKQVTYNYNPSYYACGLVYQPEQNPGNQFGWSDNEVMDLSSYNPGTTQTYYAANTPVKSEDETLPGSPKPYPDNRPSYQGSGLVYVGNTQTGHLLVAGRYRSAAYEAGGNQTSRARRYSASDSEAHTSPDSWSSGSSREVGFPQTDPSTWAEKYVEEQLNVRSPGGSGEVSSSHVEESQTTTESESNIPVALNVPQTDSKIPTTTAVSGPKVKARVTFSESQMSALVQRFSVQRYLTPKEMKSLAEKTGLTYKQVKTWFQNRRMKLRRHQKDNSWVSERYTLNKDNSVHGPTFSSMPRPYSEERHSQLMKYYNQHMMEMKTPRNLAYYLAAVGNAAGSTGYPPWSSNSLQAAVPHVAGWSMAPGSSHFEYNRDAFNSNNSVHNTSVESKDGEPVNSQSSLNAAVLPNASQ